MDATWRAMRTDDLAEVLAISVLVHPGFPEGEATYRNRLALFPAGCLVLERDGTALLGYAVSHPAKRYAPPPLDVALEALPADADDYYIHDVALLAEARGGGHSRTLMPAVFREAAAFPTTSLVSVYGTGPFWARYGFRAADPETLGGKLAPYGEGALYMLRDNRA